MPYKALFGTDTQIGLRTSVLPTDILERMVSEEDFIAAYSDGSEQDTVNVTKDVPQAERMVKRSRLEHVAGNPGDNVIIPIPLVDRGKGDPCNIMGVIVDRNQNDSYCIAVHAGLLKG